MDPHKCGSRSSFGFFVLAMIRGTTPMMMWIAVRAFDSIGLVVAFKCAITLVMFLCTALWRVTDQDTRFIIKKNLKTPNTYWKLLLIGAFQSALPHLLLIYSLQYFPPTLGGAFMVSAPWWSALFERLPCIQFRPKFPGTIKIGIVLGIIGLSFICGPVIKESIVCQNAEIVYNNTTLNTNLTTATTTLPKTTKHLYLGYYDTCVSPAQMVSGLLSLIMAPIIWGSVAVFWKFHRKDINLVVSSVGQNFFGGVFATIFWLLLEKDGLEFKNVTKFLPELYVSILFLGLMTGWVATLLVQYLYGSLGSKITNQVMTTIPFIAFIEDCIFIKDVVVIFPWVVAMEIFGLLLVTAGVFVSNIKLMSTPLHLSSTSRNRRGTVGESLLNDNEGEETSGFYTSVSMSRGFNNDINDDDDDSRYAISKRKTDYAHYEPPPMIIQTEDDESSDREIAYDNSMSNKIGPNNLKRQEP